MRIIITIAIVLCVFAQVSNSSGGGSGAYYGSQCPSGGPSANPNENDQCFSEDTYHKTSYPGNCQQYLECDPSSCTWRKGVCYAGQYWNDIQGECVEASYADCCGAMFGAETTIYIKNDFFQLYLDDCRSCGGPNWDDPSLVIGWTKNDPATWNQQLVAKQRDSSGYYSFAFNMGEGNHVKVVSDIGIEQVMSQLFDPDHPESSRWTCVPIPEDKGKIRIMSVSSGKAMTMSDATNPKTARVVALDTTDPKQEWIVEDVNGNQISP